MTVKSDSVFDEFLNFRNVFYTDKLYDTSEIKEGIIFLNDNRTKTYAFDEIKQINNKDWRHNTHVFFNS